MIRQISILPLMRIKLKTLLCFLTLCSFILSPELFAQNDNSLNNGPVIEEVLIDGKTSEQIVEEYQRWSRQKNDWAFLSLFQQANAQLPPPVDAEQRVVLMGDSITQGWSDAAPEFFANKPYIERGISGQTTPQMLVRFREDVIKLQPAVVVILAGTNDLAGNTGPASNEMIQDNLASMAEIAASNGIKVVLSSILPVYDYPWATGLEPSGRIISINAWMQEYCELHGHFYLDYFSSVVDERNGMNMQYSYDGVHANKAGYTIMEQLLEEMLEQVLTDD